uniref:Ribonuclease H-like domain-containing protein n=1 Tax=Tanacetum cinerariifolium TaxID=118510 RepID=A0A6L2JDK7_TANCI|nr:ribonuclease H-like domain-containing protein [Tanacetum cinerariifolium]
MYVHGYTDDDEFVPDMPTLISKPDISDPLHLHPNGFAALTVISVKLKGTENYQVWSCDMLLALEGLDECYMQIRSNILSRDVLPDVRNAYAIISSKESHRVISSSSSGTSQRSQSSVFNSNVGDLLLVHLLFVKTMNLMDTLLTDVSKLLDILLTLERKMV